MPINKCMSQNEDRPWPSESKDKESPGESARASRGFDVPGSELLVDAPGNGQGTHRVRWSA